MKERHSRQSSPPKTRPSVPWVWLGLGALTSIIGLSALIWSLSNYLTQPPDETSASSGPTIIQLTAPTLPAAVAPTSPPSPTVAPTATSIATPDLSVAPPELTAGYYAQVAETGGIGVTVRNGPSTSNQPIGVAGEGTIVLVIEGPTPGGEYEWWRIQMADGTSGWAAGDFLLPSAAP